MGEWVGMWVGESVSGSVSVSGSNFQVISVDSDFDSDSDFDDCHDPVACGDAARKERRRAGIPLAARTRRCRRGLRRRTRRKPFWSAVASEARHRFEEVRTRQKAASRGNPLAARTPMSRPKNRAQKYFYFSSCQLCAFGCNLVSMKKRRGLPGWVRP